MRKKMIWTVFTLFCVGLAAHAFAGSGPGHGRGTGHGAMGGACWASDLSQEDQAKLQAEREAFHAATKDLRRRIYQKELALKSEFSNDKPDAALAAQLQKELSDLESELDQQRLSHRLKMKEINPEAGMHGRWGRCGGHGGCGQKAARYGGCRQ